MEGVMTHADIIIKLLSEYARISKEEAVFAFGVFRAAFPTHYDLDKELSEAEASAQITLYRSNPGLMRRIAETIAAGPGTLPTA